MERIVDNDAICLQTSIVYKNRIDDRYTIFSKKIYNILNKKYTEEYYQLRFNKIKVYEGHSMNEIEEKIKNVISSESKYD